MGFEAAYIPPTPAPIMAPKIPIIVQPADPTVNALGGTSAPPADFQMPAQNYADAFNPANGMYSVNTGNANVRDLESLASIFSTAPSSNVPVATNYEPFVIAGIGMLIYFFLTKGK